MIRLRTFLLLSFILLLSNLINAQDLNSNLVQFSGVVVSADSLKPIPFCDITIVNADRGTTSDINGYFSFVALKKDIIEFTAMGFSSTRFVISDTITRNRYSLIQALTEDTILLAEALIYPWPSVEQFKQAFINVQIPDDDIEIARKNLEFEEMKDRAQAMPMDGAMNFRNMIDRQTSKLYYVGQLPPNNLLNPFAWAQFIKAWREGKFKRKK